MLYQRVLVFLDTNARSTGEAIVFKGTDGDKIVTCAISREALENHFNGDNKDMLRVFKANRERIEHEARWKYLRGRLETDGSVLMKPMDL